MVSAVTTRQGTTLKQRIFQWLIAPELSPKKYTRRVAIAAIPIFILCCLCSHRWHHPGQFVAFIALFSLVIVTSLFSVRISTSGITICPVLPIVMAVLYLFGPAAAVVADVGTSLLQLYLMGRDRFKGNMSAFQWSAVQAASQQTVATGFAGLLFQLGLITHCFQKHSFIAAVMLSLAAVISFYINVFIVTTIGSKAYRVRWDMVWYENHKWMLPSVVLLSPLGFIMGALTEQNVAFGALFIVMPVIAAQRGFVLHEKRLAVYRFGVDMLGRLMQEAHPYTHGHLHRVATWAKKIGESVGLGPESMALIGDAAILHDIGKIAIDDRILNKPGKLSQDEWEAIKTHPVIGSDIASEIRYLDKVSLWVRHHHERVDGAGYPDGLVGESIPLESRIISVVDAFDAMVGGPSKEDRRTYREPMSFEAASAELLRCAGTQFDEYVVMSFLRILDEEQLIASTAPENGDLELTLVSSDEASHKNPQSGEAAGTQNQETKRIVSRTSSRAV
jgi:HD-GYP domain-containing protein (c-di-GMP phosphodiesterase class II)